MMTKNKGVTQVVIQILGHPHLLLPHVRSQQNDSRKMTPWSTIFFLLHLNLFLVPLPFPYDHINLLVLLEWAFRFPENVGVE